MNNDNINSNETGGPVMDSIQEVGTSQLSRRSFLKFGVGGGVLLLGGGALALRSNGSASAIDAMYVGLAATDGWISMPVSGVDGPGVLPQDPFFPDTLAPDGFNVYSFGFRDVSRLGVMDKGLRFGEIEKLRGRVQHTAPVLHRGLRNDQWEEFRVGEKIEIELWNLGLSMRPDLADGHTIHWHGFPNQIPYYDGVPETSISVPVGRSFVYEFLPDEAGTYMYHCHFEDVEHVQMGMTGVLFVRPADYDDTASATKTVYGAGTGSEFNREFTWMITEIDLEEHWLSSHVQQPDWTEHRPDVFLVNGRTFPDTLLPSFDNSENPTGGSEAIDAANLGGANLPERLAYQPVGALLEGEPGEKVLLRIANLGFRSHSIELAGLPMRIVGIDAQSVTGGRLSYAETELAGHGDNSTFESGERVDASYVTNSIDVAPGASYDIIIEIPAGVPGDVYPIGSRGITGSDSRGGGSMRSELHVKPIGSLGTQSRPNF